MLDAKAFAGELALLTKAAIARAVDPLLERIEMLEKRAADTPMAGPAGKDGVDGKDGERGADGADGKDGLDGSGVSLEDVTPMVMDCVTKAAAALPAPQDGKDGADGKDGVDGADGASVSADDISELVASAMADWKKSISLPKDGEPGAAGRDGADGKSVGLDDLAPQLEQMVSKAVASLRVPAPGRDGRDGKDGIGAKGVDGRDGADGFGFDDLQVEHDGERRITMKFVKGERVKQFESVFAVVLDRGVYRESAPYEKGDGVTWGGSFWIAQKATDERPDGGTGAWRLAVKKGRDGK